MPALLAAALDLPREKVTVLCPFTGGMFGSKATTGAHVILAAIASRRLNRPVRAVLTREQVLTTVGHRPKTVQRVELGAEQDGTLTGLRHHTTSHTALKDEFVEPTNITSRHHLSDSEFHRYSRSRAGQRDEALLDARSRRSALPVRDRERG